MTAAETAELARLAGRSGRVVAAVNYNVRFYPLVPRGPERHAGPATRRRVPRHRVVPARLAAATRPTSTGGSGPGPAASCGPSPTSAPTGSTSSASSPAWRSRRCAPTCGRSTRSGRPAGGAETFTGSGGRRPGDGAACPSTTEDYGSILLRFRGGAQGCLTVSQVTAGRKNCLRFDLAGSRAGPGVGQRRAEHAPRRPPRPGDESVTRDPAALAGGPRLRELPGRHAEGFPDSFKQFYRAVYAGDRRVRRRDAVRAGRGRPVPDLRRWAARTVGVRGDPEEPPRAALGSRRRSRPSRMTGPPSRA